MPPSALAPAHKQVPRGHVGSAAAGGPRLFGWPELEGELFDDRGGDFVLDREYVLQVAIVSLGPKMTAAGAVDKLGSDPDPVACFAHAALQDVTHAESRRDIGKVMGLSFI